MEISLWGRANEMYSYSTVWCSLQQAAKPALRGTIGFWPPATQTLALEVSGDLSFLASVFDKGNSLSQASVKTQHHAVLSVFMPSSITLHHDCHNTQVFTVEGFIACDFSRR